MTVVGTRRFRDGLTVRYAWFLKEDWKLVIVLNAPFQGAQVEFTLAFEDYLLELF